MQLEKLRPEKGDESQQESTGPQQRCPHVPTAIEHGRRAARAELAVAGRSGGRRGAGGRGKRRKRRKRSRGTSFPFCLFKRHLATSTGKHLWVASESTFFDILESPKLEGMQNMM